MYQPAHFREERLDVLHGLIRAHPFGTLVTMNAGRFTANAIPFLVDAAAGPLGTLRGHVARANDQWRTFEPSIEALVIFQGEDGYITPSWYATKRETGKVVPTWNYAVVQARGTMRAVEEAEWLADQVAALTRHMEERRSSPWSVTDAPEPFIRSQLKGIVGIEIPISAIEGKWKASQNRPEADRKGVIAGLSAEGDDASRAMAAIVAERG